MKLTLEAGERDLLLKRLGLAPGTPDTDLEAAIASRLVGAGPPAAAASGPVADASALTGPSEYPTDWLPESGMAPWRKPLPAGASRVQFE